jgi:hypothetical protein
VLVVFALRAQCGRDARDPITQSGVVAGALQRAGIRSRSDNPKRGRPLRGLPTVLGGLILGLRSLRSLHPRLNSAAANAAG